MSSKRLTQAVRAYMRENPGVGYQQSRDIILAETPTPSSTPELLRALGITNLKTHDFREVWARNDESGSLRFPLGRKTSLEIDGAPAWASEDDAGRIGPHGAVQGIGGTAKSYTTQALRNLSEKYGPEHIGLVFGDFKGEVAFPKVEKPSRTAGDAHHLHGNHGSKSRQADGDASDDGDSEYVYLDISEMSEGGTGPHGMLQGVTGSGKSYLLRNIVLSLAAQYSPERIAFILVDFKSGSTFRGMEKLPHTVGMLNYVEHDADVVEALCATALTELERREELFHTAGVRDHIEYRKLRSNTPEMESLPEALVILDEFPWKAQNTPRLAELITALAFKGRALGVHLLLSAQHFGVDTVPDVRQNMTFGISLRTNSPAASRFVLGSDGAVGLPLGTGEAIVSTYSPGESERTLTRFKALNSEWGTTDVSYRLIESINRALLKR